MHEHFDAEGNKTGYTIVTRESLWDDDSRGRALRLQAYEDSIDAASNIPAAEAFKDQTFDVTTHTNHAARLLAVERRRLQKEAEKGNGGKAPEGWDDGLVLQVRPLTDDELRKDPRAH